MGNKSGTIQTIVFGKEGYQKLSGWIRQQSPSKIFVLVDALTHDLCLPIFLSHLETETEIEIIEIEVGEAHKNIETCTGVWAALSELGGDRKSLVINLGGGVVTDLGGFVACTFKRGVSFVQVPTTLLAMVDAAIGGKNGVDLGFLKNQIGLIQQPNMILIDPDFLETLPDNQLKSGFAEMLKHGLIRDEKYWTQLSSLKKIDSQSVKKFIKESVIIKTTVVDEDPTEQGLRKILNFGHTLGHAIETYFLTHDEKQTLLHGEAIAIGMLLEAKLSEYLTGLSNSDFEKISSVLQSIYAPVYFDNEALVSILSLMKHDKKNSHGNIQFVLLEKIGRAVTDVKIDNSLIIKAFNKISENQKKV